LTEVVGGGIDNDRPVGRIRVARREHATRPGGRIREAVEEILLSEGLDPRPWSDDPLFAYSVHSHPYEKVLFCVSGSIVFHTEEGDLLLEPGDRLEIDAGVDHAATVGESGVECVEAARPVQRSRGSA
jgi:mannose-6-phosphate isomerase-like protein (cupin superfamily)